MGLSLFKLSSLAPQRYAMYEKKIGLAARGICCFFLVGTKQQQMLRFALALQGTYSVFLETMNR